MAKLNFAAAVDEWCRKTDQRLEAVFKLSTQFVIEDVLDRTPVDTGFLRASLTVTTNGMLPIRAGAVPAKGGSYQPQPYALALAGAELGDTIYASFVAAYAGHVEYGAQGRAGVGMVRLAAQNWQIHVNRAAKEAKTAAGG